MAAKGVLLYGGSFNPLHIGHLRLAIEALEWLGNRVSHAEFLPTAEPPHKLASCLLPFDLRVRIIRACINGYPDLDCNELENTLPGPSYTYRTLEILAKGHGSQNLYFLLGSQDFALLEDWKNGLDLPALCNLVIAPRGDYNKRDFERQGREFWPDCAPGDYPQPDSCLDGQGAALKFANGNQVVLLPVPFLDISATEIRKKWLCGLNVDFLMPAQGLKILNAESRIARQCWQEKECSK